ncbi:SARP family transcriptional regulator [Actinorhabdospora filicis]|uniref:SARP family transcriptional regulator n=1 Tax=Actinorhabdospora filicis TaxID=1785913 RepID=A0A9W6SNE2_9ACTN|nr:BTAD domain-containing putative transcriptional regulator [Actinorhabdospora filicis]GLZ79413.1 SARP family transcriptional regulator [Actinorhabdospora filicis]
MPTGRANDPDASIAFRLLGSLEAVADGRVLGLGGPRQHKLLAVLLLNLGATTSLERIIDTLWESPPRSAKQQVHNAIGSLRRALAPLPDVEIVTSNVGYLVQAPDEALDLHVFRERAETARLLEARHDLDEAARVLRSALDLWRGPALEGLDGPYLRGPAEQLGEERLVAEERLMSLRLRLGESAQLVGELIGLTGEHPLRESLRASLMLALSRSGRQAEALAVYEDLRGHLAEELGIDPSPQLRELHTRVLRGEEGAQAAEDLPAASVDVPWRVGSFLPRDVREFTGRSAEVGRLLDGVGASGSSALVISAIDGMGGLGKTTLAVHLAHLLADEFPDGHYFQDLQGFSLGRAPITAEQALEDLLRETGVPAELVPSDPAARERLWRSRLAGRRALIVLDNASDEAQIRPLIPGAPKTLVLITSRRRLTALEGTFPLSLDVLPVADAAELFVRVAGEARTADDPDTVRQVVELCGRLPLAIRIAAARFRDRESWTMGDLLSRLRTRRQRVRFLNTGDRDVMAVLKLSYDYLPEDAKRMFRLLSLCPGSTFAAPSAAALCGSSVDEAEACLDVLFEHSLLLEREPGRYMFHDLVRDCAVALLEERDSVEERRAAMHRLLDQLLHLAYSLCQPKAIEPFVFTPDITHTFEDIDPLPPLPERYGPLVADHETLVAASRYAAENGWLTHAWQIPCAMMPYLRSFNYGTDAEGLFTRALEAAREAGDRHGEIASTTALAKIARDRGMSPAVAESLLREAIAITDAEKRPEWGVKLSIDLGMLMYNLGRAEEAYELFSNCFPRAVELGLTGDLPLLANNCGAVCRDLGRFDEAIAYFEKARSLARTPTPPKFEAVLLFNIGFAHQLMGQPMEALLELERALVQSTELRADALTSTVHAALSEVHRSLGDIDLAFAHGRDALDLARRLRQSEIECMALNALGEAHIATGAVRTAETVFTEALTLARSRGLTPQMARATEGLAHVDLIGGDPPAARRRWSRVITDYPGEWTSVNGARRHLDAPEGEAGECPRCAGRSSSVA